MFPRGKNICTGYLKPKQITKHRSADFEDFDREKIKLTFTIEVRKVGESEKKK